MNFDWTINITGIIALGTFAVAGVVAWVRLNLRVVALEERFGETEDDLKHYRSEMTTNLGTIGAQIKLNHDIIMERLSSNARELAEFKLDVAKNYAGNTALDKVEERVVKAIEDLGKRVDRSRT